MPAGLIEKQPQVWMRPGGMALAGPLVFVAGLVGVLSPRSMAFCLPLLMLAAIVPALVWPAAGSKAPVAAVLDRLGTAERRALAAMALFAIWALISTLWSSARGHSSVKSLYLLLVLACFSGFSAWAHRQPEAHRERLGIGRCVVNRSSGIFRVGF